MGLPYTVARACSASLCIGLNSQDALTMAPKSPDVTVRAWLTSTVPSASGSGRR